MTKDHEFESRLSRVRTLAREVFAPRAAVWDRERRYCHDNIPDLLDAGLMGMTLPEAYGGQGASWEDAAAVAETIAGACALTARVFVEGNMGGIAAVMAYGTEAQKRRAAELVLAGDKPAICITEPEAGSAATEMRTTARRVPGGWVLNGVKHWITGGGVSKLHLIFARRVGADGREEGIGAFLAFAGDEGLVIAGRERTLGLCGMPEARIEMHDLFVPGDMALETPGGPAKGFARLMSAYNSQRVGAGAIAIGIAAGAEAHAKRYLLEREQFGRPIAEFQGLQWMLADIDARVHAGRLMLREAARSRGQGEGARFPDQFAAARAKMFATENAIAAVDASLQIFGARGYGSEEPLERMYRDVRMFTIGGGTAQVLRTQVAGHLLGIKTPQTRAGYQPDVPRLAAE